MQLALHEMVYPFQNNVSIQHHSIGSGLEPSWMKAPNLTVLPMISVVLSAAVAIDVVASSMTAKINVSRDSNFFSPAVRFAHCGKVMQ